MKGITIVMKRFFIIFACILLFICGCEKNLPLPDIPETNKIETVFPNENVIAFDFDADGKICIITFGETGEFDEYSLPVGEVIREPICGLSFSTEDEIGSSYALDEENGPANLCVDGDIVYYPAFVLEKKVESIALFRYFLKDNTKEKLHTYRDITLVKKMLLVDDKIFMPALDPSRYGNGETGDDYYNAIGGVGIAGNVKYSNGRIYFIDNAPQSETFKHLICADISAALRTDLSKFLTLAYSVDSSQAPSSLGFSLIGKQLDPEEFALTVLSQEDDCDLFLFTSQEEFSYNVKNKGSFYPLNNIDGVEQYLNDCFPFIRDAMTDENGNIWALPISIRVDTLCYNENVSESCGLNFSGSMVPDESISAILNAQSNELTYFVSPNLYSNLLLRDYLSRNISFNTASFHELAGWIKMQIFKNEADFSSGDDYYAAVSSGKIGDIDFDL